MLIKKIIILITLLSLFIGGIMISYEKATESIQAYQEEKNNVVL